MTTTLSTIGYEGASLDDFLDTLKLAGIKQVIDIRDVPASRRPGFSKNVLCRALLDKGISYQHLKALGDPKPGREAARQGRFDDFIRIYNEHLSLPAAQEALKAAVAAADDTSSVLLCYERDFKYCHRKLVSDAMSKLSSFLVQHLGVQKKPSRVALKITVSGEKAGTVSLASS